MFPIVTTGTMFLSQVLYVSTCMCHLVLASRCQRKAYNIASKEENASSVPKELCCVCCQPIMKGKDESLFCGGDCQQWLHRY